jgi:hypothetical protein
MSAIYHEIMVKKPYKFVKQILEQHYNNSLELESEYKFVTSELEIMLVSNKPKETLLRISFPNRDYIVDIGHLKINQLDVNRKKFAYFVQKQICNIYDILGKKYCESSNITLHWTNVTTWIPFIYPQFAFELVHNLPGKDFLENGSRFNAKFDLAIYDKTLYCDGKNTHEDALFYKIRMELKGIKKDDGIEMIDSNYHHTNHSLLSTIIPQNYIDKSELWLHKYCENQNKNDMLTDFVDHIIQIMNENN